MVHVTREPAVGFFAQHSLDAISSHVNTIVAPLVPLDEVALAVLSNDEVAKNRFTDEIGFTLLHSHGLVFSIGLLLTSRSGREPRDRCFVRITSHEEMINLGRSSG